MSERCDKCGAKWDAHEFAVPAPYCPQSYEQLESQLTAMRERAEKAEASAKEAHEAFEIVKKQHLIAMERMIECKQRAEAAEQRIKELELQDSVNKSWHRFQTEMNNPVAYGFANSAITGKAHELMMVRLEIPSDDQYPELWIPLYKHPILPPEVESLQRENAELSKKLTTSEKWVAYYRNRCGEVKHSPECDLIEPASFGTLGNTCTCGADKTTQTEELNKLLSEARKVPEVTDAMAIAFHHALTDGSIGESEVEEIKTGLRAALSASAIPSPERKA